MGRMRREGECREKSEGGRVLGDVGDVGADMGDVGEWRCEWRSGRKP
jgi:hypothetical protein